MKVICEWYARCTNQTNKAARGPIGGGAFGPIPCCDRCADKHNLDRPYEIKAA